MSNAKCPTCQSTKGFEAKDDVIGGYPYPVILVQCKNCHTAIGTQLFPPIVEDIKKLLVKLYPEE